MIQVITSVIGERDNLIESQNTEGAEFIAFVDKIHISNTWKLFNAYDRFKSPRRNSRIYKMLPHKFFKCEYSLWIDGNLSLKKPAQELIDLYLKDHDIAVFKHPKRDCIYQEALECCRQGLDNVELMIEQVKSYEDEGFPKNYGLGENMIILRRHTKKVEQFNNMWWAEYCRFSVRDQLSFMYCADKVGLPVKLINEQFIEKGGIWSRGGIVEIVPHLKEQKETNG